MSIDTGRRRPDPTQRSGDSALIPAAGRRLRIEFLVNSLVIGGAERVVEALCRDLPALGVDTGVGCLREAGPIGETLRQAGTPLVEGLAPARRAPLQIWRVRRHLRAVGADVAFVLDHSNALLYGRLAARLAPVRAQVCAVHRTGRADGRPSLGRVDRWLMPLSARVIAVSAGHARYLAEREGVDAGRIVVIHNGVDPQRFGAPLAEPARALRRAALGLPAADPILGIVAALRPEKDHAMLLAALAQASRQGAPTLQLVVVGEGALLPQLRALAQQHGVADRVHWLGRRLDVPEVLACLDGLVLSSKPVVETFPLCVLEGMAASLPIVATDVGSLREQVVPGQTGWLVPPGDAAAFAVALTQLLGDRAAAAAMGRRGRARVESQFTQARMVARTAELLRSVAGLESALRGAP